MKKIIISLMTVFVIISAVVVLVALNVDSINNSGEKSSDDNLSKVNMEEEYISTADDTKKEYTSTADVIEKEELKLLDFEKYVSHPSVNDNFTDDSVVVTVINPKKNITEKPKSMYFEDEYGECFLSLEKLKEKNIDNVDSIEVITTKCGYRISDEDIKKFNITNYVGKSRNAFDVKTEYCEQQILKINLKEPSKENVIKLVEELQKDEDVLAAEPNYIFDCGGDHNYSVDW